MTVLGGVVVSCERGTPVRLTCGPASKQRGKNFKRFNEPESKDQNLFLAVSYVPPLLDGSTLSGCVISFIITGFISWGPITTYQVRADDCRMTLNPTPWTRIDLNAFKGLPSDVFAGPNPS